MVKAGACGGMILALGAGAAQALTVDVEVVDSTTLLPTATPKDATIMPGDSITVGVFLIDNGVIDNGTSTFGLGAFQFSVESRNEQFNTLGLLTPWPVNRTPTDTVLNGLAGQLAGVPATFDITSNPIVKDDNGPTDLNDTDLDVVSAGRIQSGASGYTLHVGGNTMILLGTATFTALSPQSRGLGSGGIGDGNTAQLNTYFVNTAGNFGGLDLHALTTNSTAAALGGNPLSGQLASAGIIGTPVNVTIGIVPEPATIGLIGLGTTLALVRRRR